MKRLLVLVSCALVVASALAGAQSRATFDRTLNVSGPVRLEVSSGSGSITVRTGGDGTVEIHGDVRARAPWEDEARDIAANPLIHQDGNVIKVGPIEDRELRRHVSVSYEVVVPVQTALETNTGSGSQSIEDIAGPLDATSGSGSLDIGRIGGDVEASTGSGSITIAGVNGDLDVSTGSGRIRAEGVNGAIDANSGSGSVRLEQTGTGDVSVQSGSGRVRVAGVQGGLSVHTGSGSVEVEGRMTGDWDLHASSGSLTVTLPDDAAFDLDAKTSSGGIDSDHPIMMSGRIGKNTLRGEVRGGGPLLALRTSSGSIRIR